ncbi:hypothetical protein JMJ35_004541 [Cladonia borealis]|uniref:AB hydrolase-1 domain-containing protein n=1 Tax=Cladonia borealis TaxID=184061 RepID=A0AA39R2P6_9LECA|nr:hypothetical protein JMJ35_004541 [Cladonia borealis]
MALQAFPSISKTVCLDDGTTYAYVHVPAAQSKKPTLLLLHGFPSSSWDWRHQIAMLKDAGYGVVAPDLLGYGDTDKPEELEAYSMKRMSGHMAELLKKEGLGKVVGVAHDWGSGLLARITTYYPECFLGTVFVSVGYIEPGLVLDIDAFNGLTKQLFGYPTFGYWKWFNTDGAADTFNRNPQAAFSLIYPTDPEIWKTDFCPVGSAAEWIAAGKTTPLPEWVTEQENAVRNEIMERSGYNTPLIWYKSAMRGINHADEADIPHQKKFLTLPNMLVVSTKDYATRADMQEQRHREWTEQTKVEVLDCGHWIQLEKKEELVGLLSSFADELAGQK